MAVSRLELQRANLVLVGVGLLQTPEEFEVFKSAVDTEVQVTGAGLMVGPPTNMAEAGRTLTLRKDRIVLELFPQRSTVGIEYPTQEGLDRLAEVAGHAITTAASHDQQQLLALGYNSELTYDQDSGRTAFQYLAERLFATGLPGGDQWQLSGGMGTLIFADSGRFWRITIEPRFNDEATSRIFMSLNLHQDTANLPNRNEIIASLSEAHDQARALIARLDESK